MENIRTTLHDSPKSFPEDFDKENGNYQMNCFDCHQNFIGLNNRFMCKQCQEKRNASDDAKDELRFSTACLNYKANNNGKLPF